MAIATGRAGQMLILEGWIASHADSGSFGHIHFANSDGEDVVLRSNRVGELGEAMRLVALENPWRVSGADYPRLGEDDNDPALVANRRDRAVEVRRTVAANLDSILAALRNSPSVHEAVASIAPLIGASHDETYVVLARFSLADIASLQ